MLDRGPSRWHPNPYIPTRLLPFPYPLTNLANGLRRIGAGQDRGARLVKHSGQGRRCALPLSPRAKFARSAYDQSGTPTTIHCQRAQPRQGRRGCGDRIQQARERCDRRKAMSWSSGRSATPPTTEAGRMKSPCSDPAGDRQGLKRTEATSNRCDRDGSAIRAGSGFP